MRLFDDGGTGQEWELGSISKTLATDFPGGDIPSWLSRYGSSSESTGGQGGLSGLGGVALTSHNNPGIEIVPFDISDTWLASAELEVTFTPPSMSGSLTLGFEGTAAGAAVFNPAGETTAALRAWNSEGMTSYNPANNTPGVALRAAAGVRMTHRVRIDVHDWDGRPKHNIHVWTGGAYWFGYPFGDAMGEGAVTPKLRWSGLPSSETVHIHQVRLTRWWL